MDIPIGTWCAFVLCTTHNAQSKKTRRNWKKIRRAIGDFRARRWCGHGDEDQEGASGVIEANQ
ncbi:hypothetical protein [Paraburkholderia caribensis]|uniref:hypothetical protein n=1 Tax=Paraburkholderia caribensis TaxID=75105 RepID=UPI0011DF02D7|nr:hypothetical protein [Paraburkholderia caribensis]